MAEGMKAKQARVPGIKQKLFVYLLSFCLLLIVILVLFQTVFLDRFYIYIKRSQVENEIGSISSYVVAEDWQTLQEVAAEPGDLFVEVWSPERGLVLTSGSFQDGIHIRLKPSELDKLFHQLQVGESTVTRHYQSQSEGPFRQRESIVSAQLIETGRGERYIALVSAGLSPIQATVDTLRVQLFYISGIMLLLSVGLALLISRNVSAPLVAISDTAVELGQGHYEVVFHGTGYNEVVQLADTLTAAARELSRTEELRRELVSNVSHDLRTPLTLIAGYAEMIRDMPGEATAENMQVIIDEAGRLTGLVSDLLDLSRLQAGVTKLTVERFDLMELVSEIAGRIARFYEKEGYLVRFEPGQPVVVEGDRDRLAQVIYNFMLNAVQHTGADKTVEVRLRIDEGQAKVAVSDSGSGVAAEDIPYIWERYYKTGKRYHREAEGSGLGLAIARSVLQQHPGVTFGVDSQPGEGTTFWFSIPWIAE